MSQFGKLRYYQRAAFLDARRAGTVEWRSSGRSPNGGGGREQAMADDRVVLTDDEGNYYVLPREVLERFKVTGPDKIRVRQALDGGDTTGFAFEIISPNQTFPDQEPPAFGSRLKLAGILRYGQRPAPP